MVLILKRHLPTLLVLGLTFLAGFSVYLLTLAPTVTFEDSGELITAAYHLGIPHQPGYPLFTLLGRTFSLLPLQNVAYRLNLMSAFLTALGAMFICWAVILFIDDNMKGNSRQAVSRTSEFFFKYAPAFGAGMMMISAFEIWEQSLITEVYGLNNLFVSLFIFILVLWHRQRDLSEKFRYFFIASYLSGLAFSNHTTSLMFLPIMVVFIILWDRRIILNAGSIAGGLVFFALGVTPYIYLPVASARNPWMDWGNPENWTNFIRTVSRHQYGLEGGPSLEEYLPQLVTYGELILQQWVISLFFAGLFLAGFALYKMFKERNPLFYIFIFFFILAAPLTTYLTNFDVTVADVFVASENKALVSVFYIPSYILIAFLAGIGVFKIFQYLNLKTSLMYATAMIFLLIILVNLFNNYSKLDMSNYTYTEDYVGNVFSVADERAVIFANWDPFYFPLNYYQFVEGQRMDVIAIDQQLLRRSWYIQWLADHYPNFMKRAEREVREFLTAVKPFEEKKPYDGNFIQVKYVAMINALIDQAMAADRTVYFTYTPGPEIREKYSSVSVLTAMQLVKQEGPLPGVDLASLKFRNFHHEQQDPDRWVGVFRKYYAGLFISRGQLQEQQGDVDGAIALYTAARIFYSGQPAALNQINRKIELLQSEIEK